MNISEEKEHLYKIMSDITQERRELTQLYYSLKERLDKLNKLEERGLEELDVKGYIDMYKHHDEKRQMSNINREFESTKSKIAEQSTEQESTTSKNINKEVGKSLNNRPKKQVNQEKVSQMILSILKESGTRMRVKDIYNAVLERDSNIYISYDNFRNNIIYRARNKNKNIVKISSGVYQYQEIHN